ncbi:unnamed protein product [Haemonchus placei]|uniref:Uncharacterized protein n=1 Tax=Haemonchus placei TaxID=6290 RepID=A0A3P7YC64_HAEPC|nr:unnamed protein product [Haemonchus placei]
MPTVSNIVSSTLMFSCVWSKPTFMTLDLQALIPRSAMSSAKSKSVSLLRSCQLMPALTFFIVSLMTKSRQTLNRIGDRMHPCRTPVSIWKNGVYPVSVLTQQDELRYKFLKMLMNDCGTPYVFRIAHSDSR